MLEAREDPAVQGGRMGRNGLFPRVLKMVDVRIERKILIGMVQRREELAPYFLQGAGIEFDIVPRIAVHYEVPAEDVRSIRIQQRIWVKGIALLLGHLVALFIKD